MNIIELMVAVSIALFMFLAMSVVFLSMKTTSLSQDQLAQLEDNERLALTVLTTAIESAGYFPDPLTSTVAAELPAPSGPFAVAGQPLTGTEAPSPGSDTLATRYVSAAGDGLMNCRGETNATSANFIIVNQFSVNAANELVCSTDGGVTSTALVSNVKRFTVLYATDTTGQANADQYLTASAVQAGALWTKVRTVRLLIDFINPFAGQPGQSATIQWVQSINRMNKT